MLLTSWRRSMKDHVTRRPPRAGSRELRRRGPYARGGPVAQLVELFEDRTLLSGDPLIHLPLTFEPNDGQTADEVDFLSRGSGAFNDASADTLTGGTEQDWLFKALDDLFTDPQSGELVELL